MKWKCADCDTVFDSTEEADGHEKSEGHTTHPLTHAEDE